MVEKLEYLLLDIVIPFISEHAIEILFILLVAYLATIFLGIFVEKGIRKFIKSSPDLPASAEKKREDTLIRIISGTSKVIIWILAILTVISNLGVDIGPLIAGAGIVGIAVGFGGQYLVRDLVTGIFILLENQYRVGDVVKINNEISGKVEDISLRLTVLRDLNGVVHHIPHGEIQIVSNLSKGFSKVNVDFGISYEDDIDEVIKLVDEVGEKLAEDDDFKDKIIVPPKCLGVNDLADSAVILKIVGDTQPGDQWEVGRELRKRLKVACDKEGVSIPFPQITVNYKDK